MLLYNATYRNAKTGRQYKDQDISIPFMRKAPAGMIADLACVNGGSDESYSVDDQGRITAARPLEHPTN